MINSNFPNMITLHSRYDNAIIGVNKVGKETRLVYNGKIVLDIIEDVKGISREQALEVFNYNINEDSSYGSKIHPIIILTDLSLI